jgi:hypothetical protein
MGDADVQLHAPRHFTSGEGRPASTGWAAGWDPISCLYVLDERRSLASADKPTYGWMIHPVAYRLSYSCHTFFHSQYLLCYRLKILKLLTMLERVNSISELWGNVKECLVLYKRMSDSSIKTSPEKTKLLFGLIAFLCVTFGETWNRFSWGVDRVRYFALKVSSFPFSMCDILPHYCYTFSAVFGMYFTIIFLHSLNCVHFTECLF